jgi:hypothetical protein
MSGHSPPFLWEVYTYPSGKKERRYTPTGAGLVLLCRLVVLLVTLPFLIALRAVSPDAYDDLDVPTSVRLTDGSFFHVQ